MVAQRSLTPLVLVRVQAGQPLLSIYPNKISSKSDFRCTFLWKGLVHFGAKKAIIGVLRRGTLRCEHRWSF